ncbi:hypothetical protein Ndes2526A_g00285 [Nannochloris sp. 'desiccata']
MAAMLASAQGVSHGLERLFQAKQEISIGRNPSNTIVLNATISPENPIPDSLVLQLSRHHAKLRVKNGELQIMDNSTLNGTFINNLRIPAKTWKVLKNFDIISLGGTNPLELEGLITDNPWTFKVKSPEEFLARYVAPSSLPNAETQSQGGGTRGSGGRAREVYSFSAGRGEIRTRNLQPTAPAQKRSPAEAEVIDLTFLEDSPPRALDPARPKSALRKSNHTSGPGSKRARAASAASIPSPPPPASAATGGDGAVTNGIMEEFTCPICQELIVAAYSLVPCGHNFCGTCLSEWLANKQDCPNCRERCMAPPVRSNAVDNVIALTVKGLDDNDKKVYEVRKKEWEQNKAALELKLKDTAKFGGGAWGSAAYGRGRASGMPVTSPYVNMIPGMMRDQLGALPGMEFLLQGFPGGPSTSENPRHVAMLNQLRQHQQQQMRDELASATNQRRTQVQTPQAMSGEQRFRCQYATAGGVQCKGCRRRVNNNELILGMKTLPSRSGRHTGGGVYEWYHFGCFPQAGFRNARVVGFENMRNISSSDASRIRERLVM